MSHRPDLHRQDRDVVPELATGELGDELLDGADGLGGGTSRGRGERVGETVLEVPLVGAAGIRDPVSVEEEQISLPKLEIRTVRLRVLEQSKRQPVSVQDLYTAIRPDDGWPGMP